MANNFLNSEQKIIYAEKRVKIFLNNAEQKIILCRMLEIVYAKKKQWTIFMRKQWTVLINVENRFYECNKQIQISQLSTLHASKLVKRESI